jgi:hypothetical protein
MLSRKLTMSAPSGPSVAGSSGAAPVPPPASSSDRSTLVTMAKQARRPKGRRSPSNRRSGLFVAAAPMCAVIGLSAGCATSPSATATPPSATPGHPGPGRGAAGGSNARSGPAAGGSVGTVGSLSTSSFTMSTAAGQKVAVNETSSTKYRKGTSPTSASSVKTGGTVLVLGTTNGTTITATQVIVQPTGGGSAASPAAKVIPFQRGAPTTSKKIGQIPENYTEGAGTIVSGTTANKATEAALAAYPGGVVDRVVKLSNGEYEAHNIGVNWPHHVFVHQDFKVVGAD